MAQFDIYKNPNKDKRIYPFVIDIQHSILSDLNSRLVIPLGRYSEFKNGQFSGLTPGFKVGNTRLILLPHYMSSLSTKKLATPVGSLADHRDEIIAAIDMAVTGA